MADLPDQVNEKLKEDCAMEVDNENNETQVDDKEAGVVRTSQAEALGADTEVWVIFNPFNRRFPPEEMMHRFNDWLHRYQPSQISK